MTDATDNSSLPLLMAITGAVVVVAVGGWFFLDQGSPPPERNYQPPPELLANTVAPEVAEVVPANDAGKNVENDAAIDDVEALETEIAETAEVVEAPGNAVEVELHKARLAADAELHIYPADQSAFHYYGQILSVDPYHALASAELDAVLGKVAVTVNQHMNDSNYAEAYGITRIVATLRPEHELVINTQRTLDQLAEGMVTEAMQYARSGKDTEANQLLDDVEKLPGRNADYLAAMRESIIEIRDVRVAAERDRANRAKLAENDAKAAWMASVRAAISAGNLVAPAGASARDLLAETKRWAAERAALELELLDAILMTAALHIESYEFDMAELLIATGENYPDRKADFDELSSALETAYIALESNKVKRISDLVAVKMPRPQYPRAARVRSTTGWVEIYFTVAPDGSTQEVEINRSEPEDVFDSAAIKAVTNWKFEPVEYRGQFISQRAATRLVFDVE